MRWPPTARRVVAIVVASACVALLAPSCASSPSAGADPIVTQVVVDPPVASVPGDQSMTFATRAVPEGWGIVAVDRSTSVRSFDDESWKVERISSLSYGRPESLDVAFVVTTTVRTTTMGEWLPFTDARSLDHSATRAEVVAVDPVAAAETPPNAYASLGSALVIVDVFDRPTGVDLDAVAIADAVVEISRSALSSLSARLAAPGAIVATADGGGADWRFEAVLPLRRPDARGPAASGCAVVRVIDIPERGTPEVCASTPTSPSVGMLVDLDLTGLPVGADVPHRVPTDFRLFVVAVVESTSRSFVVRSSDPSFAVEYDATVLESPDRPDLRWIVVPVDAPPPLCWEVVDVETGVVVPVGIGVAMVTSATSPDAGPSRTVCGQW